MKTLQNIIFIFATILFLQSCVASSPSNGRKSLSSSVVKTTTTPPGSPVFATDEQMYWFSSVKVTGTITVNKLSDNVIYLRGSSINNFLVSKNSSGIEYYRKTYCMIGTYGTTATEFRVRAVPIYVTNYSNKTIERILRIDIPSLAENTTTCAHPTIVSGVSIPIPASAAYSLAAICPTCSAGSMLTSTSLKIFEATASSLIQVPTTQIALSSVALKVDLASNSSDTTQLCSNSSCSSKGFDCCIEGQCVKDASMKPNASSNSQYSQALSDYSTNPLSFINYPNIYNICTNISHTPPPTTTPGTTPVSDAQARVAAYLADYTCIDKVVTTGLYSLCLPSANESQYLATKKKLAIACGCPATYDDTTRAIKCPDWGVRPLYKSSVETITNIVDFYCYTPKPVNPIGSITNLNVTVPSRSAPHRFFSTGGTNYDDLNGVASSVVQEGEDFYYLDNANKASPVNGSYNVNSIIGRINVGLSQAQPAKMVGVELGKTYILSTTSGYFTPCSKCAKDSWFQTFTAHPSTTGGNGLRASGFTTARDGYSANTTLGNYEDTKFGRACYLPVTMIPWSHKKEATTQLQRLDRLKTQAAYYINGYQRDWFGFNKGALIGSFDGVTWFAIGSGRRITATSTKIYLAYNSSFLDLADRTDTIVNIIPDLSASTAPDFDYDPELGITDKSQNMAGTCQKYHQCETDTDCITQLGWEYSCTDMSQLKSRWPIYDTDSKEIANQEKTGTLFEILAGTATPGASGKRCVYRGAGAPCLRDITALDGNFNQKALTCAPNFYCATLTANKFNDQLVRSPNEFDDILFGMDTNVLGRPLNYVTASKNLSADIIGNIKYNGATDVMGLTSAQVDDMGICRPGRSLSTTASIAHSNPDTAKRSDYISQVGSCNSASTGSGISFTTRTTSCPALGADLNYVNHADPNIQILSAMQNSCGGESKNTGTAISAFASIEGGTLALLRNITQPTLAADACFRRAGSACFTDLDCGPNKLHSDTVGSLNLNYFGGTQAEQSYWQENLVCAQGTLTPALGSAAYKTYELNQNRCCREIGKDFTMFTAGPATIVPENMGTNVNLDTKKFATYDPKAANRYSRYSISETAVASPSSTPMVTTAAVPEKNQWKVINETGSLTCCGGGWIRKFADGTHDWTVKNRLAIETSNFQCLNFRSPLVSPDFTGFTDIVKSTFQREYEYFCKSPSQKGCLQILFRDISGYTILPPLYYEPSDPDNLEPDTTPGFPPLYATSPPYTAASPYSSSPAIGYTRLDTGPVGDITKGTYTFRMNADVPYQPFPYTFTQYPYDLYTYADGTKGPLTWFSSIDTDYGVSFYLPAYIPYNVATSTSSINQIYIKYYYDDGRQEVVNITNLQKSAAVCDGVANFPANVISGQPIDALGAGIDEAWCYSSNSKTQNRPLLNVKAYTGVAATRQWAYASVIIDFQPLEIQKSIRASVPGNAYYYLTKLGRLELIGIPQITYEPIYCNNNQDNLVPGIFTSSIQTRAQFNAAANTNGVYNQLLNYDENASSVAEGSASIGNIENKFTFQDKLSHAAVFSSKDFTCCTPLGKETASGAKCCSGYAKAGTGAGVMTCKLPVGADLNVYFNKFVSGEGIGDTQPGGGLLLPSSDGVTVTEAQSDFNQYTGEPKLRDSTFQKIEELGKAYCANAKVGNGGSFGQFPPEPYSGYVTPAGTTTFSYPVSIVDSILDSEVSGNNAGKFPFDNGFRWDHHYYCK